MLTRRLSRSLYMKYTKSIMITDYTTIEILPEIGQHQVRYEEYILDTPKNPKLQPLREFLPYGALPIVDCEVDDDCPTPDYSKYILPNVEAETVNNTTDKKNDKKEAKQCKAELSLDYIYTELREMKLSAIRTIIKRSKNELLNVKRNNPSQDYLSLTQQMYSTMFNPDQKYWIYMYIRETLKVPPHAFREVKYIYTILAPEAAFLIFQKKFKLNTKDNALKILTSLVMSDQSFFEKKAMSDLHCRT